LEAEKFILALKNENVLLRKKNQALIEKNRTLEEKVVQFQKKMPSQKANALIASKVAASLRPTSPSAVSPRSTKPQLNNKKTASMTQKDVNAARSLHRQNVSKDLEAALKNRLVIAEKQLVKLQAENAELKRSNGRRDNNEDTEGDDDNNEESGVSSSRLSKIEVDQLQRELRDRQAQLVVLNARYDNLEAKANAERSIQDKTLQQMETMNRTIHKLRSQLQDIQLEKELLESKIAKANELENEIKLLREQNRRLEERMTSLCESPFINDAFQRKERIDKLIDLEKETQQQKMALKQLTEDNQRHVLAINELQTNIRVMKNAKDSVEQELEKVKSKLMEERHAASDAISAAQRMQLTLPRIPGSPTKRQIEQKDACSSPLRSARSAMGIETTKTSASDATKVNPDLLSYVFFFFL
jgi:hypothetical protein